MKAIVAFLVLASALAANAAGELDTAVQHGETDKARAIDYKPGETMTFTLRLQGATPSEPHQAFSVTGNGWDAK